MAKRPKQKMARSGESPAKAIAAPTVASPLSSWFSRDWLFGLILVFSVILAYSPVWHAGFIWDDDAHVTANPVIIGPLGLKEIWTTSAARICPLVLTTFWMEHALWGLTPLPYHLVNVLLHGTCAIVLWRVLRSLQVPGAWLGAALWALHPVQVETAAWITEMKNTQSGLFYLLTILFFVRGLKARAIDDRSGDGWNYALTLLCAALAMASKSSTVVLPVVLGLCAWWVEGRWQWRNLARLTPIFLMSMAASTVSIWTQNLEGANDLTSVRSGPERLITAGNVVWFYMGKLLWPHPLIFIYPRWKIDIGSWFSYLPLLAVMIVLFLLWLKRESWSRPYFFAFAYFLAALLPVLGLVNQFFWRYSFVGDHFQYLASMGPLALAGVGITRGLAIFEQGKPWLKPLVCGTLLTILGALTWSQTRMYGDIETLWRTTIARNPACWMAYNNLGISLDQTGRVPEEMEQYEQALRIKPDYAEAHNNLGLCLRKSGRVEEAIEQYEEALQLKPDYAEAHSNLGTALQKIGRIPEAIDHYKQALQINPDLAKTHFDLGLCLQNSGQVEKAIEQFKQALQIKPDFAEAYYNLGNDLLLTGRVPEAMELYEQALRLKPNYAEAHNNLGVALEQRGQVSEAIKQYQEASQLKPDYTDARNNLARAQALQKAAAAKK